MVAETKESMAQVFDGMADGFRSALDAGRRSQAAYTKAFDEFWQKPMEGRPRNERGEKLVREWAPFFGKSVETLTQTCDATMRSGLDVFKAACEASMKPADTDPYEASRRFWDATFGAARTGFDVFGKAGAKTIENCSAFCDSMLRDDGNRTSTTPGKGGKTGG